MLMSPACRLPSPENDFSLHSHPSHSDPLLGSRLHLPMIDLATSDWPRDWFVTQAGPTGAFLWDFEPGKGESVSLSFCLVEAMRQEAWGSFPASRREAHLLGGGKN